jgi:hypothetical protein
MLLANGPTNGLMAAYMHWFNQEQAYVEFPTHELGTYLSGYTTSYA